MNKNKKHNQDVFHDMCKCVLFFGCTTVNEITEALHHIGVRNTVGNPYTPNNLRQLVHKWNQLSEDDVFRQDHIDRYLPQSRLILHDDESMEGGLDEPIIKSGDVEKYHNFFNSTLTQV
jgi:beta-xylosidase